MLLLQEALADTTSNVFEVTKDSKVWIHLAGTFGGDITMERFVLNLPGGDTWGSFLPNGSAEIFTSETTKLFDLPGGVQYRFSGGAGVTNVDILIDGNAIRLV